MTPDTDPECGATIIDRQGLSLLIERLTGQGRTVIGPQVAAGAVVLEEITSADELPTGLRDEHDGGRYRLSDAGDGSLFGYVCGPQSWKRHLLSTDRPLWRAKRSADGIEFWQDPTDGSQAFIGVRACDIAALQILDKVYAESDYADPGYVASRDSTLIVAVDCGRPGGTCFCTSMDTGPAVTGGFDIRLTELCESDRHVFVARPGSEAGAALLRELPSQEPTAADFKAADAVTETARTQMGRSLVDGAEALLRRNLESPHWNDVAQRCLACANCTLVCPTCFCHTLEDTTDLTGETTERWRHWDSCYTLDFSYIHGGSIRREVASRYRQWITHKLSYWHEQFGVSGCVGCGRCITWCPVGIDITAEARALANAENKGGRDGADG